MCFEKVSGVVQFRGDLCACGRFDLEQCLFVPNPGVRKSLVARLRFSPALDSLCPWCTGLRNLGFKICCEPANLVDSFLAALFCFTSPLIRHSVYCMRANILYLDLNLISYCRHE